MLWPGLGGKWQKVKRGSRPEGICHSNIHNKWKGYPVTCEPKLGDAWTVAQKSVKQG